MKPLKLLLALFCISISCASAYPSQTPRDSAKYKWVKGEKFLLHKVQPKETWNSISRKYDIAISELMRANLGVIDLKIGQVLHVPSLKTTAAAAATDPVAEATTDPKYKTTNLYTVRASETLFSIAKKFNCAVDDIKKWNSLESNLVREGQKLVINNINNKVAVITKQEPVSSVSKKEEPEFLTEKSKTPVAVSTGNEKNVNAAEIKPSEPSVVKKETSQEIEVSVKKEENKSLPDLTENPTRTMLPVGKGGSGKTLMQVTESGICSWISDGDINQNKYYGLHRSAPIGTIIKVTNRMNNKYVFVKVVGVLPDTGDNEKSILKISQASVNKLGALDAHFQVELSYGMLQ